MTYPVTIGEKEYTRQQLLDYGKAHYPKYYWIPRGIGIANMFGAVVMFFANLWAIYSLEALAEEFNTTPEIFQFQAYIVASIIDFIIGLILFLISFKRRSEQDYISHAIRKLSSLAAKENYMAYVNNSDSQKEEEKHDDYSFDDNSGFNGLNEQEDLVDDINRKINESQQRGDDPWKRF